MRFAWPMYSVEILSLLVKIRPKPMANGLIGSQPSYIISVTSAPLLWAAKLTFFLLYLQLFRPMRWLRISIYIGAVMSTLSYTAFTLSALIFTTRRPGETWEQTFTSRHNRLQDEIAIPVGVVGLLTDIYLLILPSLAVSKLQLQTARKIGLMLIFSTGFM